MGTERKAPPVKLFFGLIASDEYWLERARRRLAHDFSHISHESALIPFNLTGYYEDEMGPGLLRQWIATEKLIPPAKLVEVKRHTNRLELLFAHEGKRRVNIDPGYVSLSKVVLATTKDHAHRLYVGTGIYEEVTLVYRRSQGFEPWPWTYPDYRLETARKFFLELRCELRGIYRQLRISE
ncbi:MAG: DUF4416 family protein [Candidatus Sumerlaeaceae bacterium]|jgi:hypothetical protein